MLDEKENTDLSILYTDLVAGRLGGKVLYATDDFFAEKENLIKSGRGIFIPDKYTDRGKWMDGWESKRHKAPDHDWCVLKLAAEASIKVFDIDTNHFLGNHPPHASVEGLHSNRDLSVADLLSGELQWEEILPKSPLQPGSQNIYESIGEGIYTHLRLHIYPDGGVARFRAYGDVHQDWSQVDQNKILDLAAAIHGGRAIQCSDMYFSAMNNLIMPGDGINMGDGWETKRSREENHSDWVIIKLACPGTIMEMVVDTKHFKGNYPDCCVLEGCFVADEMQVLDNSVQWTPLIDPQKLQAHKKHHFNCTSELVINHVRFTIYPDGGVSRLRLMGKIESV